MVKTHFLKALMLISLLAIIVMPLYFSVKKTQAVLLNI
jgi:hypothetical protein